MATDATLNIRVDSSEVQAGKKSLDDLAVSGGKAEKGVDGVTKSTTSMSSAARTATGVITSLGLAMGVREVVQYADEWQNASNRLRLVTKDSQDLTNVQRALIATANDTRAGFSGTAELFTVLTRSTKDLNLSQQDTIALTKTINQSFAVSGASAAAMDGAIRQLAQGLQSGALRGDEFNSIAEQAPGILDAVAASLQMGRGELRDFAAQGGITSEVLVRAIQDYSDVIESDFGKAQATFGQSMTIAKNNALEFVGASNAISTATSKAGEVVVFLSENIGVVGSAATAASVAMGTFATISLVQFVSQMSLATAAQTAFNVVARANPYVLLAAGVGALSFALIEYVKRQDEATESLKAYVQAGGALGPIAAQMLKDQAARIEANKEEAPTTTAAAAAVTGYGEKVKITSHLLDAHVQAQEDYKSALEKAQKETIAQEKAVADLIVELKNQNLALGMTDRAQAIFNATTLEYSRGTAPEQIAIIAELTARNYDLAESNSKAGKAAEDAAKQSAENWQRTHEYLSDAFVDIMNNGGNAFDNIAKAFERTVQRMVAEWAASGLMNLFGMGGGSSGGGFSFGGGGSGGGFSLGNLSTLAGSAGSIGQFVGGAMGSSAVAGSASFVGPMAPGMTAGGMGSAFTALATNPVTWAVAALAIAAKNDFWKDPDNYKRSFAGMLTAPTSGAAGSTFSVDPFASGFNAQGIAHGASQQTAIESINVFRAVDAQMVELVTKLGGTLNLANATLSGTGIDGVAGTSGTFLGMGGKTTEQDIAAMVNQFVGDLSNHVTGIDDELLKSIKSARSAEEVMSLLSEAVADLAEDQVDAIEKIGAAQIAAVSQIGAASSSRNTAGGYDFWNQDYDQWGWTARYANGVAAAVDGSHANGADFIPYDNYKANTHQGEAILTSADNKRLSVLASNMAGMQSMLTSMAASMGRVATSSKKTADLLTQVTRDGNALLTEAA